MIKNIFQYGVIVIIFLSVLWFANEFNKREVASMNKIDKCIVENKELLNPKDYCYAAIRQGVFK